MVNIAVSTLGLSYSAPEGPGMLTTAKYKDVSWDFRKSDTKEYTHCFHNYPAMMIPQVVRKLLERYGVHDGWLLDPYCGTGTSLVEASIFGMNAVGCDINPLVRLIATAKTTPVSLDKLDGHIEVLQDKLTRFRLDRNGLPATNIPHILNMDYWFSNDVAKQLSMIREHILSVKDAVARNFLWVAFSETVRECSYTKNGEFKLVRMAPDKLESHNPDVFGTFIGKLARNRDGLAAYIKRRQDVDVLVTDANTANDETPRPPKSFDLVITSPPYGDSPTTVAYGQFSRLSAEWIGLPNPRKVDRLSMGGTRKDGYLPDSPVSPAIEEIRIADRKRARQVESFYFDLRQSIRTVTSVTSDEATVCYVAGNRRVKGVTLPTDEFVAFTFGELGFSHEETVVRNIPNKRMPSVNSPSNVTGKTDTTMREESIVVCQRRE
ncbi:MAG: DNA methyltransferase [Chloroflexi bacterium]|nr:DNA methyltransferase [Chloroflexota bacterium]